MSDVQRLIRLVAAHDVHIQLQTLQRSKRWQRIPLARDVCLVQAIWRMEDRVIHPTTTVAV